MYWEAGAFLFNLGVFSLSLFFCGVRVVDQFLFLFCPLGVVSSQSGEEGGVVGGVPVGWSGK